MTAWLQQYQKLIPVALAALAAAGIAYFLVDQRSGPEPLELRTSDATPQAIEVYITGAVARPGVYEMADGDRVIDLLTKAGGFANDANPEALGLAKRLNDEDTVVVPHLSPQGGSSQVAGSSTAPVNINSATQDELIALPGIGPAYSQRIIDSRSTNGPFARTDELLARAIIPESTFEQIKDLITAGP